MKKVYLILAAAVGMTITSCTNNEYIGDVAQANLATAGDGSIQFSGSTGRMTRADHVGADAATKLGNKFYVVAFIGDGSSMTKTFDNYLVEWNANTAGKTTSNTSDWEYVDKTAPDWSGIAGNTQTIKYWDYSKGQYDFIAWSPGGATPVITEPTDGEVRIFAPTPGSYNPTYSLKGGRDDLAKCYIADMVTAYNPADFQKEVKFSFRSLGCKVRIALYETIPGYSVRDVKFYTDASTDIATGAAQTYAFLFTSGSTTTDVFYEKGTYTIDFPNRGSEKAPGGASPSTDYNKAHVTFTATSTNKRQDFGALNLVGKETSEADVTEYIGRTLPTASYAGVVGDNYYKTMLPNETGTVLMLRVDYTLVPTDGANETIKVHGATAFVPQIYATWKPNYAYTYVFKISDNTNGWTSTSTTDPAGLYPITFDAIVVDSEEHTQSTITTVSTPSITTYQLGHNPKIDGSIIDLDEYSAGDIYVMAMDNNVSPSVPKTDIATQGYLYAITNEGGSSTAKDEANVMDALNIKVSEAAGVTTGRNGLVLTRTGMSLASTIPGVDGNDITISDNSALKFSAESGKTYAFCYLVSDEADTSIYSYVAVSSSEISTDGTWFEDPDGITPYDGTFSAEKKYYKKYTNLNKVYAVKVIKVE